MKTLISTVALGCSLLCSQAQAGAGRTSTSALPQPQDVPYPGKIQLSVDATDVARRIVHVREVVTGLSGESLLLYPKWLPGVHAPDGPIQNVSGLRVTANDAPVRWKRDTLDPYAFHVTVPPGAGPLT